MVTLCSNIASTKVLRYVILGLLRPNHREIQGMLRQQGENLHDHMAPSVKGYGDAGCGCEGLAHLSSETSTSTS